MSHGHRGGRSRDGAENHNGGENHSNTLLICGTMAFTTVVFGTVSVLAQQSLEDTLYPFGMLARTLDPFGMWARTLDPYGRSAWTVDPHRRSVRTVDPCESLARTVEPLGRLAQSIRIGHESDIRPSKGWNPFWPRQIRDLISSIGVGTPPPTPNGVGTPGRAPMARTPLPCDLRRLTCLGSLKMS